MTATTFPTVGKQGCARFSVAVTPSDTVPQAFDSLYIGVTGDVTIIDLAGNPAVTYKSVAVGFLDVSGTFVKATGTTATNIVAQTI